MGTVTSQPGPSQPETCACVPTIGPNHHAPWQPQISSYSCTCRRVGADKEAARRIAWGLYTHMPGSGGDPQYWEVGMEARKTHGANGFRPRDLLNRPFPARAWPRVDQGARESSPQEGITPAARPQQSLPWASLSTLPVFNSSPPSCLAISISQSLTTHHLPPPFQPAPRQSSSPPGPAQRYLLRSIFACAIGQSLPLLPPPSYSARQLRKEQSQ